MKECLIGRRVPALVNAQLCCGARALNNSLFDPSSKLITRHRSARHRYYDFFLLIHRCDNLITIQSKHYFHSGMTRFACFRR